MTVATPLALWELATATAIDGDDLKTETKTLRSKMKQSRSNIHPLDNQYGEARMALNVSGIATTSLLDSHAAFCFWTGSCPGLALGEFRFPVAICSDVVPDSLQCRQWRHGWATCKRAGGRARLKMQGGQDSRWKAGEQAAIRKIGKVQGARRVVGGQDSSKARVKTGKTQDGWWEGKIEDKQDARRRPVGKKQCARRARRKVSNLKRKLGGGRARWKTQDRQGASRVRREVQDSKIHGSTGKMEDAAQAIPKAQDEQVSKIQGANWVAGGQDASARWEAGGFKMQHARKMQDARQEDTRRKMGRRKTQDGREVGKTQVERKSNARRAKCNRQRCMGKISAAGGRRKNPAEQGSNRKAGKMAQDGQGARPKVKMTQEQDSCVRWEVVGKAQVGKAEDPGPKTDKTQDAQGSRFRRSKMQGTRSAIFRRKMGNTQVAKRASLNTQVEEMQGARWEVAGKTKGARSKT
ncbi:uncharacterized protein LAESUDRAFT_755382 [Laetiporus sulphureus 93-53]|uniref:Uncharacterized protein n=1 Tax=Laetiporus sulphureus 93-53 TaxID=1314785 RepID=A0A165GR97_9APHY|nr:uncharacterized protein LAESUDRAFT_755382 [Laetiporus sulphureus 93-53]KZT10697.1 hypothetical protein LAESUDRAFT_755382 [Laetiporus sulphureus 93-53]